MMSVYAGIDLLLAEQLTALDGLRVGLVTNNAATTLRAHSLPAGAEIGPLTPVRQALVQAGVDLVRLFAPEHGLGAAAADGDLIEDAVDPLTGLPVVSLYGAHFAPSQETLADLDLLIFDIPDVGVRFYTYIWTLSYVMEACAAGGLPLMVLDRPNPLGGLLSAAEGPLLEEGEVSTFVGRWRLPVRHSLTVGELARYWQATRLPALTMTVVQARDWRRDQDLQALALPFVPPSPNMPNVEAAGVYPGTCFFEGTNVSEGRGTSNPFQMVGAPWLDGIAVAADFNALALPGIVARAVEFEPCASKYAGQLCRGVMLHVTDRVACRPVAAGLHLVALIARRHPEDFAWLAYATSDNALGTDHFDRLVGRSDLRAEIDAGRADQTNIARWTACPEWAQAAAPYLLYPMPAERGRAD